MAEKPYSSEEVNPYTTNVGIRGLRKLGIQVIGVGKLNRGVMEPKRTMP